MYFSYAFKEGHWTNPYLIGISVFVAGFLPYYTKISDWLEQKAVLLTGKIFIGKATRFIPQSAFNIAVLYVLVAGKIVNLPDLKIVGGSLGAAALTTASSQGLQYLAKIIQLYIPYIIKMKKYWEQSGAYGEKMIISFQLKLSLMLT